MHHLETVNLAMDGRMLRREGTGISTYARALHGAQRALSARCATLVDDACVTMGHLPNTLPNRMARWIRAMRVSGPVGLQASPSPGELYARDIFRLAFVRFRQTGRLLSLAAPGPSGIVHWSLPAPIHVEGWINIYTVHDVIPLTHAKLTPMHGGRYAALLARIAEHADHIVSVSDDARDAIIGTLGCAADQVTNCGQAVDMAVRSGGDLPLGLSRDGYFVYAGANEARKNVARLVAAWRASGRRLPLVLIGDHGRHRDTAAGIVVLPHQPRDRLAAIVAGARAMLFPSLAEGFGLPVVEAMALGTAVLTSDIGATREVAGDAALLIDPYDMPALSHGIERLSIDDTLTAGLVERGRTRAAAFSTERFTTRLQQLYGSLLDRRHCAA